MELTDKRRRQKTVLAPDCEAAGDHRNVDTQQHVGGGLIFDPFMGSGTVAVAAKNLGRHYIGFEIDPKWHKVATDRLNNIQANGQITIFTM